MSKSDLKQDVNQDTELCPNCKADFDGGPIPEDIREHYSPPYRWSRKRGIVDLMGYDGVSWWQCPDCQYTWKRFPWLPEYKASKDV